MKLKVKRETLLRPLQIVNGVVERRQTLPILSNLLIKAEPDQLILVGTDLEVEMVAYLQEKPEETGEATLPARKVLDICRTLPEGAEITLLAEGDRATVRSGKSRFRLSTLPAVDFPSLEDMAVLKEVTVCERELKHLIERTHFAMAQQDVRYYLNGLMLEIRENELRAVATDGHRLAMSQCQASVEGGEREQLIVPRKGVTELLRLLEESEDTVTLEIGANHLRIRVHDMSLTTKLIDGRFPDYERVLPQGSDKLLVADKNLVKDALTRTSILSNEKFRGVRFALDDNVLKTQAHNPEQEEAEEEIEVQYQGDPMEIGFNASYVLDALNAITGDTVRIQLSDPNSSCLITPDSDDAESKYVVMPMRL
ncbi:MAG: DNA polymerase III subunit beta [Gammaproteobacteria bacterium]